MAHLRKVSLLILILLLVALPAPSTAPLLSPGLTSAAAPTEMLWPKLAPSLRSGQALSEAEGTAAAAPTRTDPATLAKIAPQVLKELAERGQATFLVYLRPKADLARPKAIADKLARRRAVVAALQETATRSQRDLIAFLEKQQSVGAVTDYIPFWIFNGLAVTGDLETALAIAARPEVERIRPNQVRYLPKPIQEEGGPEPQGLVWNVARIRADAVWKEFGITGQGVVVANMDTGVEWTHPALRNAYRGGPGDHDYNWADFTDTYPNAPGDGHSHGTHTMGTIVGDDGQGNQIGVAPGARWIAVKIFDDDGRTEDVFIHQGFQWLLAPTNLAGENPDPGQAPDVVNNSWGSINGGDPTFLPDVEALRAAGIFPVFAAGNNGENGVGTIESPGSFPIAFSVGATDPDDLLAPFSSQGPSFWEEIKPEVSAPGRFVRSSAPGDEYLIGSGTSMATPHAVGTAALLLSANPDLGIEDLENFMMFTAMDLGPAGADNEYGAGRLDAYEAVRWALSAGKLYGQVADANTAVPLAGAAVRGVAVAPPGTAFSTTADATGTYSVSVPSGIYDVTASAFGHLSQTVRAVEVVTGFLSLRDFALPAAPTGVLTGRVTEAGTGVGLMATVAALDTPAATTTDATGHYTLTLPLGTYQVRASSLGHRSQTATVTLAGDGQAEATQDFTLPTAPSVLLIDGDAWAGDNVTTFYRWALDQTGYLHDTWVLTDTANLPGLPMLSRYDIVILAHPSGSPGWIDYTRQDALHTSNLSSYLSEGGRLLISGQEVGYWDATTLNSLGQALALPFYRDYLHARYVRDDSGQKTLTGVEGDVLDGVQITLNDLYADKNQNWPDEITPGDELAAAIITYDGDGTGGLRIATGDYRAVYLSFGLEGAGPRPMLAETFQRAIAWLNAPSLIKEVDRGQAQPGEILTYSLTVKNTAASDVSQVTLSDPLPEHLTYVPDSATGGAVFNAAQNRIEWAGALPAGSTRLLSFQAQLDVLLEPGTVITNTAILDDGRGARSVSQAVTTIAPSPLAGSTKGVDKSVADPGTVLTYTIVLSNASPSQVQATVVDPLPPEISYVPGSASGGATYNSALNRIEWEGLIGARTTARLGFQATVDRSLPGGTVITNTATLSDGIRVPVNLSAVTAVRSDDLRASAKSVDRPQAASGDVLTYTLTLRNRGAVDAANVVVVDPIPAGLRYVPGSVTGGAVYNTSANRIEWRGDVPPTQEVAGNYVWRSSGAPDGPTYNWIDITTTGTRVTGLGDDINVGPFPVGFDFPFYGNSFNQFYLSSNGFLSFSPISGGFFTNVALPSTSAPRNLVAMFWDDLTFTTGGQAYYWTNNQDTLVVSYVAVNRFSSGGPYTFQGIFRADGSITLQYASMQGTRLTEATIGIQNDDRTQGLTIAHNEAFVYDGLALLIEPPPPASPPKSFTFQVRVLEGLAPNTVITNTATISDGRGGTYERSAVTRVNTVDLSRSTKTVDKDTVAPGDVLSYTITLHNSGTAEALNVRAVDPLPEGTAIVPGSVTGGAVHDRGLNQVEWRGSLGRGSETSFGFAVTADPDLADGVQIVNTAVIEDGLGLSLTRVATSTVRSAALEGSIKRVDRAEAASGDVLTYTIALRNASPAPAGQVSLLDPIPPELTYVAESATGGASYNAAEKRIEWSGAVPGRGDEYVWLSSDDPDGPAYAWVDIAATGTPIEGLRDDDNRGPFPIGFPFRFYGQTFTTFRLSSNGFLSFTDPATSFSNQQLPTPNAPRNLVAAFWDDLNPSLGGSVTFASLSPGLYQTIDQDTLVVSFIDVPRFGGRGPYTFQIILDADGVITFQYQAMGEPTDSATVGIQNADGSQGLTIAHDGAGLRLHDRLAVQIGFPPGEHVVTFQARVADGLPLETEVRNTATIGDGRGGTVPVSAVTRVNTVDLSASSLAVDRATALPTEKLRYTVTLRNAGTAVVPEATVVVPIPLHTAYVEGSATGGAVFEAGQVKWAGTVPARGQAALSFEVAPDPLLADGTVISTMATLSDGLHPPFTRQVSTLIQAPDLSGSDKRVTPGQIGLGGRATYTIRVKNTGSRAAVATLSDPLPGGVRYVEGSAWAGSGAVRYDADTRTIHWQGTVPARGIATVTFQAEPVALGTVTNVVTMDDGLGRLTTKQIELQVRMNELYLPLVLK